MNIGVIYNSFENLTGIPSVVYNTMSELLKIDNVNHYFSVYGKSSFIEIDGPSPMYLESGVDYAGLLAYKRDTDIFYSFYPAFDKIKTGKSKFILTIHDMIPLLHPEWFDKRSTDYFDINIRKSAEMADVVIAMSESTKNDVVNSYHINEDKVRVIYSGLHTGFSAENKGTNIIDKYNLKSNYILTVCTIEPRKNLRSLIRAFDIYKQRFPNDDSKLVVAGGKGWDSTFFSWLAEQGDVIDDIVITGYVTDDELSDLYNSATAIAYVSYYEGFGLPILEGMAAGKAVICSDTSSMPEVGGEAVCYCNPYSVESIADAVQKVLTNEGYRVALSKKAFYQAGKFSYINTAKEVLGVINELL